MYQGKMQLTIFLLISLAQYGALGAPVGAMESSVAQDGLNIPSLGAPRTFELFYPELPNLRRFKETTTTVPVIHLQENDKVETMEKAASDAYLEMFPQDLLNSEMKIKPINVRIIEHDGFIDYEIEFVELSEEQHDDYDTESVNREDFDTKNASNKPQKDFTNTEVTTKKIATTIPVSTSTGVTAVTFVDLLRRARRKHREKISQEEQKTRVTTGYPGTPPLSLETTQSSLGADSGLDRSKSRPSHSKTLYEKPRTNFQRRNRIKNKNKAVIRNLVKQRMRYSQESVPRNVDDAAEKQTFKLGQRFTKAGSFSTFKPRIWNEHSTILNPENEVEHEKKDSHLSISEKSFVDTTIETVAQISNIMSTTSMSSIQKSITSSNMPPCQESATLVDESTSKSSYQDSPTSTSMPLNQDSPKSTSMSSNQDSPTFISMSSNQDSPTSISMSSNQDSPTSPSMSSYQDSPTSTSKPSNVDSHKSTIMPSYKDSPTSTIMTSYKDSPTSTSMPAYQDSPTYTGMPSYQDSPASTSIPFYKDFPTSTNKQSYQESSASSSVSSLQEFPASTSVLSNMKSTSATSMESAKVDKDNEKLPDNLGEINLIVFDDLMEESVESVTKEPLSDITTTLSLIEELKHQLKRISDDLKTNPSDDISTTTTIKTPNGDQTVLSTNYELEDLHLSESKVINELHKSESTQKAESGKLVLSKILAEEHSKVKAALMAEVETVTELPDDVQFSTTDKEYETMQPITSATNTGSETSQPERSPKRINSKVLLSKIIEDSLTLTGPKASQTVTPDEVIKGQYHEINPGQYHEINPGQYHEVNPGQYHETDPGQYNEIHTRQDLGVENVTVDFDHRDESRIYNVHANAGDFIIGEVGRIDINSGQTFQGVRYTAVEGEVDQAQISDILERYFGAQTS